MKTKLFFSLAPILITARLLAQTHQFANCVNEDFEQNTVTAPITSTGQINGWTISNGSHTLQPGSNSCNLMGCCSQNPVESAIIVAPNGYTDAKIGVCYPIFSVFGTSASNTAAAAYNPQIGSGLYGNCFIRLNSQNANGSIEKLSKTLSVTPQNSLFQYAFISVLETGHICCDAASFQIKLIDALTNTVMPCPSFSLAGPSTSCLSFTTAGISFFDAGNNCQPANIASASVFNKWQIAAMDLTPYIGMIITIEVIASDCSIGDHAGYTYFDAQCGPMYVYANNQAYAALTPTVTVYSCGAGSLCGEEGLGPFFWSGPGVSATYAVPSMTNRCLPTTTAAANYTLYMNPPGSCFPIARSIVYTPKAAPVLTSPPGPFNLCGTPTIAISPIIGGNGISIAYSWLAPAGAMVSGSNSPILITNAPGIYTVTAYEIITLCQSTAQLTVEVCVALSETNFTNYYINIFPNPNEGIFQIRSDPLNENSFIELYDLSGRMLLKQFLHGEENDIDLRDLQQGVYLIKLFENQQMIYNSKVMRN